MGECIVQFHIPVEFLSFRNCNQLMQLKLIAEV